MEAMVLMHRLHVVQKVEAAEKEYAKKKLSEKTKRQKITTLIGTLKSRQEYKPLDKTMHVHLSDICSDYISFLQLPSDNPLVNTLKYKCCLSRAGQESGEAF
jgi:hypothetical protein